MYCSSISGVISEVDDVFVSFHPVPEKGELVDYFVLDDVDRSHDLQFILLIKHISIKLIAYEKVSFFNKQIKCRLYIFQKTLLLCAYQNPNYTNFFDFVLFGNLSSAFFVNQ